MNDLNYAYNDISWEGYLRKDGRKGIRNKVLIIYTVECASFVAGSIARKIDDNDVEVIGFMGCTDNEYAIKMLVSFCRHPNVGAVLAIGLGCEYIQAERLANIAAKSGRLADWFLIQDTEGTEDSIAKGISIAREMQEKLKQQKTVPMFFSDLMIGAECGGSDYTSGVAGNTVVGGLFDVLVEAGGTAIFEEILETIGLKHVLMDRAADGDAAKQIAWTYDKAVDYCKDVHQYSISPGNFAGGLSTIEEKSMGAVVKSGTKRIEGVLKVSETPTHGGLWLMDSTPDPYWMQFGISNPSDNEGLTALASSGCQLLFYITGRGNVIGNAVAPTIKITGNSETFKRLNKDIDFNAGKILDENCTKSEAVAELSALVRRVAGGELTRAEETGHKEFYIPYKYQNKPFCRK